MIDQSLRLYQCAYQGLTYHDYQFQSIGNKGYRSQFVILGQRLLLSTMHNTGLLLRALEEGSRQSGTKTLSSRSTSSSRCFQLVLTTVHSMEQYYGIKHSDFPYDFDLDMVIQTALELLSIVGNNNNCFAAPCA
jgi:hypothetical protein